MSRRALAILGAAGLLLAAPPADAQEQVLLRRFADIVVVRASREAPEQTLYYFDATRELPQGAQVQQGSGGYTELQLSGGGVVSAHASAHLVIDRLSAEGDVLRYPQLNLLEVVGGSRRLELRLPGDTHCTLLQSNVLVELLPGRLRIRNQKGLDVMVEGLIGTAPSLAQAEDEPGRGRILLPAGQEISIPLYGGEHRTDVRTTQRWVGRVVRAGPGVVLTLDGSSVRVDRDAEGLMHEEAEVELGGVLTRAGRGRLVVTDPRPLAPPEPEAPADAPPLVVEPVAAPAAEPTPGTGAPDEPTSTPEEDAP